MHHPPRTVAYIELVRGCADLSLHVVVRGRVENPSVPDIAAVEVAQEVDGRSKWKDRKVLPPEQRAVLGGREGQCESGLLLSIEDGCVSETDSS